MRYSFENPSGTKTKLPPVLAESQNQRHSLQRLAIDAVTSLSQTTQSVKVLKKYQTLIPLVLGALREDEEETIMKVLENFNELVDVKNVLKPHLFTISQAAL